MFIKKNENLCTHIKMCIQIFIGVLFIIVKNGNFADVLSLVNGYVVYSCSGILCRNKRKQNMIRATK